MRKELEYRQPGGAGTKQFIGILQLALTHPIEALKRAVGVCVSRRAYGLAAVVNVLGNEAPRQSPRLDFSERHELSGVGDGVRSLSAYDQLASEPACGPTVDSAGLACREFACGELVCGEHVEPVESVEQAGEVLS